MCTQVGEWLNSGRRPVQRPKLIYVPFKKMSKISRNSSPSMTLKKCDTTSLRLEHFFKKWYLGKITFPFCRFVSFFGWMLKGVVWDVPNAVQTFSTSFSITLMSLKWFWNWLIQIVSRGSWKRTKTNQKNVTFQLKLKSKQRYQSGGLGIDFLTLLIQIKIQFAISNLRV